MEAIRRAKLLMSLETVAQTPAATIETPLSDQIARLTEQVVALAAQVVKSPTTAAWLDLAEAELNAWKLGPTPQNIEVVASPHSNEPSNRCPLEPAVHEVHET